eukprot:TRINITY_DN22179_c0_g2_i1.p1 TRINITY_DN22179_c0_g2~~TRINITY_DN22179_c0_g2_i1.p1  ORF type:complete len:818 (-),score=106.20 TRINITY_DN22179_c0_g2_i1:266-2695(-)
MSPANSNCTAGHRAPVGGAHRRRGSCANELHACGKPGSRLSLDWLAVRATLADQLLAPKVPGGVPALPKTHALFDFPELPSFASCPLGNLALKLWRVACDDTPTLLLMTQPLTDIWKMLTGDLLSIAQSMWGYIIFGIMHELITTVCTCTPGLECRTCDSPEYGKMSIQQSIHPHLDYFYGEVEAGRGHDLEGCDWAGATAHLAGLYARIHELKQSIGATSSWASTLASLAAGTMNTVSHALNCVLPAPHAGIGGGRWLIALLATHRPLWLLLAMVSRDLGYADLMERESAAKLRAARLERSAPALVPTPRPALGDSLVGPLLHARRYVPGVRLCEAVQRCTRRASAVQTAEHFLVVGASVFETGQTSDDSGAVYLEMGFLQAGGETLFVSKWLQDRDFMRKHGDSPCDPSTHSQFQASAITCTWPAGEVTSTAFMMVGTMRPPALSLLFCEVPDGRKLLRANQSFQGVSVELRSPRWESALHLNLCHAANPAKPRITVCPRPWFDVADPEIGNSTMAQFIEFHTRMGVEHFDIQDVDGSAAEWLERYTSKKGPVTYRPRSLLDVYPEMGGHTAGLMYPLWAVHPSCHQVYFTHCFYQNRDSEWIIILEFFDKFFTGRRGLRWNVLNSLIAKEELLPKYGRRGPSATLADEPAGIPGALNIFRLDMGGDVEEAPHDDPVIARYFYGSNVSRYGASCGPPRKHFWALIPMFRPYRTLLPTSHLVYLQRGYLQCFPGATDVWVNHYKRLAGKRFRGGDAVVNGSVGDAELSRLAELKRHQLGYTVREESLSWAISWMKQVTQRTLALHRRK